MNIIFLYFIISCHKMSYVTSRDPGTRAALLPNDPGTKWCVDLCFLWAECLFSSYSPIDLLVIKNVEVSCSNSCWVQVKYFIKCCWYMGISSPLDLTMTQPIAELFIWYPPWVLQVLATKFQALRSARSKSSSCRTIDALESFENHFEHLINNNFLKTFVEYFQKSISYGPYGVE